MPVFSSKSGITVCSVHGAVERSEHLSFRGRGQNVIHMGVRIAEENDVLWIDTQYAQSSNAFAFSLKPFRFALHVTVGHNDHLYPATRLQLAINNTTGNQSFIVRMGRDNHNRRGWRLSQRLLASEGKANPNADHQEEDA